MSQQEPTAENNDTPVDEGKHFYRIRFREDGQEYTAAAKLVQLKKGDIVMVKTDHGLEPAQIYGYAPVFLDGNFERKGSYEISHRPTAEEESRYQNMAGHEQRAFAICSELIEKHDLVMRLVRVEKFFNGSKMIFYFTADSRVDFRALVKDLVQEFRTRVEMRQVGVRHETKMLGGLGTCGRELCCSSFLKKFDSVSIKMAKEQDLPLNPTKISGVCNRLLCCLTYEFETYRRQRKGLPKIGRKLKLDNETVRVKRQNPLQQTLLVINGEGDERLLHRDQWSAAELIKAERSPKKEKKKTDDPAVDKPPHEEK
ncbi:MAG: regulatory iron-sulfur-containing complex subunit RicT [Desulfocapsaceae bacterium]|jgi:cell fate regulator YaaT (PSP1 superfamily)|nr:regulatory iron-sulfur-containing complex subunit RicT [Desulfocapsaceae bacterium]